MSAANPAADSTWTTCAMLPCACGLCPKASALPAITPEVLALVMRRAEEVRADVGPAPAAGPPTVDGMSKCVRDLADDTYMAYEEPADIAREMLRVAAWALLAAQVASDAARLAATGEGGR